MNKLIIVLLLPLLHSGEAINCYLCNTEYADYGWYDPDCGEEGYEGHRHEEPKTFSCFTDLFENGTVWRRSYDPDHHAEGKCVEGDGIDFNEEVVHYCRCYCDTDLCNNHNNEWCSSGPTKTTAEPTTAEPTTAEPTTAEPTTAEPTVDPSIGVTCYSCWGCSEIDSTTNIWDGDQGDGKKFRTCTYTGEKDDHGVVVTMIRGGDYDLIQGVDDPLCVHEPEYYTCYCTTDLCNDGEP